MHVLPLASKSETHSTESWQLSSDVKVIFGFHGTTSDENRIRLNLKIVKTILLNNVSRRSQSHSYLLLKQPLQYMQCTHFVAWCLIWSQTNAASSRFSSSILLTIEPDVSINIATWKTIVLWDQLKIRSLLGVILKQSSEEISQLLSTIKRRNRCWTQNNGAALPSFLCINYIESFDFLFAPNKSPPTPPPPPNEHRF